MSRQPLSLRHPEYFDISPAYSAVYHRFLALDLADRPAIRGQIEGPVSLGMNILDQDKRPIIFDDTVRPFLLEFMARRVNVQLQKLKKLNPNAFMFIDEPGLQFVFSGMSGYNDMAAKRDLETFFSLVERPAGIHLCGNPDWDFLLKLDMNVLSLDTYSNGEIFTSYPASIKLFSIGAALLSGAAYRQISSRLKKKLLPPSRAGLKVYGKNSQRAASTETFFYHKACSRRQPAVW